MTEQNAQVEEQTEEEQAPEVEEQQEEQVQEDPDIALARSHGWVPKDEWEGDPDEWVNHKQFNRTGDMIASLRSLRAETASLKKTLGETLERNNRFHDQQLTILKREKDELEAQLDEKIELADKKGATEIRKQIKEVDQQIDESEAATEVSGQANAAELVAQIQSDPNIIAWREKNPWVAEDGPKAKAAAEEFANFYQSEANNYTNLTALNRAAIRHVDSAMAAREKKNPNRDKAAITQGGRRGGKGGGNSLTMKDLTSDEQKIWETFGHTYKDESEFLKSVQESRQ